MKKPIHFGIVLYILTALLSSHAQTDLPKQYCGQSLTTALRNVCNGIYHSVYQTTSSMVSSASNQLELKHFQRRDTALALQPRQFQIRLRRGAYDECCRKTCTVEELSSYCA